MPEKQRANLIAQELANLLQDSNLNASQLQPALDNGMPAGKMGDRVLFVIHDALASQLNSNPQLLAIEWVNNLRTALDAPPLKLTEAQSLMYGLVETEAKIEGFASWYGDYFHGRLTANGETYNQYELTAAHRSLPFNTYLKVTNLENGESAIVRINDRGPYIPPRNLDLSRVAARCINSEGRGVVPFEAVIMQPLPTQSAAASQELTRLAAQTADRF
ncbi:MAG: septal ring lytic transglycosylase RlpA family protein [Aphanothece sp. CMT-3BRIN-NPC111]|nr:septal ring lytic transglycosylase RlpA family protein [Aphanothece sp. CMT-3BRIN-NPC111]